MRMPLPVLTWQVFTTLYSDMIGRCKFVLNIAAVVEKTRQTVRITDRQRAHPKTWCIRRLRHSRQRMHGIAYCDCSMAGVIGDPCDVNTDCSDVIEFSECVEVNDSAICRCDEEHMSANNGTVCDIRKPCMNFVMGHIGYMKCGLLRPMISWHGVSVSLFSRACTLQKRLNGSTSCLKWRFWEARGMLCLVEVLDTPRWGRGWRNFTHYTESIWQFRLIRIRQLAPQSMQLP